MESESPLPLVGVWLMRCVLTRCCCFFFRSVTEYKKIIVGTRKDKPT